MRAERIRPVLAGNPKAASRQAAQARRTDVQPIGGSGEVRGDPWHDAVPARSAPGMSGRTKIPDNGGRTAAANSPTPRAKAARASSLVGRSPVSSRSKIPWLGAPMKVAGGQTPMRHNTTRRSTGLA